MYFPTVRLDCHTYRNYVVTSASPYSDFISGGINQSTNTASREIVSEKKRRAFMLKAFTEWLWCLLMIFKNKTDKYLRRNNCVWVSYHLVENSWICFPEHFRYLIWNFFLNIRISYASSYFWSSNNEAILQYMTEHYCGTVLGYMSSLSCKIISELGKCACI